MAFNTKTVTTRTKPGAMTDAQWMAEIASKTAAQLAVYDVPATANCCDTTTPCPDHDPDVASFNAARQAIVTQVQTGGVGSVTAAQVAQLVWFDHKIRAKGLFR